MFLKGTGLKAGAIAATVKVVKMIFPAGAVYNAPSRTMTASDWVAAHPDAGACIKPVHAAVERTEKAPEIVNFNVTDRFKRYFRRTTNAAFVLELPGGQVLGGESNFIITPDGILLSDVSREFGQYGGKEMENSSLIKKVLRLPVPTPLKGTVAVVSTCGWRNFHHWNYDILPRIQLLKDTGLFDQIDQFVLYHSSQPFQLEAIKLTGIPVHKIIQKPGDNHLFKADRLIVPSLPSKLGTVSPWVVDFLRQVYNPQQKTSSSYKRIFLSRKHVTSRKVVNNEAFTALLRSFDIVEVFPEEHNVQEMATILAGASFIISVHGSGLSNLCFITEGTTVVDILAPYHQDGYYWMICNIRHARYIGFFGEGSHPADDIDLVAKKIDEDILVDLGKMENLLKTCLS